MSRHRKAPDSPLIDPGWPGFNQRCLGSLTIPTTSGVTRRMTARSRYEGLAYS